MKEQFQIAEDVPIIIKEKIESIINRILQKNNLSDTIDVPNFYVSLKDTENAFVLAAAKHPILVITQKLLKNVTSEDELAGCIAHELGHIVSYVKHETADHQNKIEELAADNIAVILLHHAGYDPNGLILFLEKVGGCNTQLISTKDLSSADSFYPNIEHLSEPHPSDPVRIRTMTMHITGLKRKGTISNQPTKKIHLDVGFYSALDLIQYQSPIAQGLKGIGYDQLSTLHKIEIIKDLLNVSYELSSEINQQRVVFIAQQIEQLSVDFNNPLQTAAFKDLTDIVFSNFFLTSNYLRKAFQQVWVKGGKNGQFIGRNEDLQIAVIHFVSADTQEKAQRYAEEIIDLLDKISFKYRSFIPQAFDAPSTLEIENALANDEQWHPPYAKHIQWYREQPSEALKNVLTGMHIDADPWAENILGEVSGRFYTINNEKTSKNTEELKNYIRNEEGTVIGKNSTICPYQWTNSPMETSKEELIADYQQQALEKKAHEEQMLPTINWSLLQSDFVQFIQVYGKLMAQPVSIVPIPSPFAEQFFQELIKFLPQADDNVKRQLRIFFRPNKNDELTDPILADNCFDNIRKPKDRCSYLCITSEKPFNLESPFIKFLFNPLAKLFFTDECRFEYLHQETEGFINRNSSKKLSEIYAFPLHTLITNYPKDIKTVSDSVLCRI